MSDTTTVKRGNVTFHSVLPQEKWIIDHNIEALELIAGMPEVVVDIGAHVGFTSLMAWDRWPMSKIYSFEPNVYSLRLLLNNIKYNWCEERVKPFQLAVTSKTGEWVPLRMVPQSPGQSSLLYKKEVPVFCWAMSVSLEDVIFSLIKTPIDFMKVDTEGGEYDIILNSHDSVFDYIKAIKIEVHDITDKNYFDGSLIKPEAIAEKMRKMGYVQHEKLADLWLRR